MGTIMSGDLRIGKTEIGIKLKSVARDLKSSKAQTHYVSPCCNESVGRKNYCKECGNEFSRSEIDKRSFDTGNEKVILTKKEIDSVKKQANDKTFETEGFVREGALPRIYQKKSYFVVPSDDDEKKKLEMIAKGLTLTGRAMVGKYVYRKNQKLAMITTSMGGLVLHNLFWEQARYDIPENFRLMESGVIPEQEEVPEQIEQLIDALSEEFEYADYESDYYEQFKELVLEAKDRDIEEIETEQVVEETKTEKDFLNAISEEAETQEKLQKAEQKVEVQNWNYLTS